MNLNSQLRRLFRDERTLTFRWRFVLFECIYTSSTSNLARRVDQMMELWPWTETLVASRTSGHL